jgi:uncharacterized RDD family membrane protein YckC
MNQNSAAPIVRGSGAEANIQSQPGNFGRRFVAVLIDAIVLGILRVPITVPLTMATKMIRASSFYNTVPNILALQLLTLMAGLVIHYFYFGWFYLNKGATPGKMLLGLRVVQDDTGTYLTYWQAFWRESIGKLISTLPLFLGYFWALGRPDRKTFHDLMFKTQVLYQKR